MRKGNIIVGQSGGPTAVINSTLAGVIKESSSYPNIVDKVYGMINGIEGFLQESFIDLLEEFPNDTKLDLLKKTPAAFLGSCRYKLPEDLSDPTYQKLFALFDKHNITGFLYIGGNDSMDTVSKLSNYANIHNIDINFIGIPKTIDNDLVETDHTPGFGSAAKFVASTVRDISMDSEVYELYSVTIIEIMGRNAGWLTGASALARRYKNDNPLLIYLPEVHFNIEKFIEDLKEAMKINKNVVVCVSEGLKDLEGNFLCEKQISTSSDSFGHTLLSGCGKYLETVVREKLKVKCRSIELSTPQRCSSILLSFTDLREAFDCGVYGTKMILDNKTGVMVTMVRENEPYRISFMPKNVSSICNKEKKVPLTFISKSKNDVTQDLINYISPLIMGTVPLSYDKNGLPKYISRKSKNM